MHRTNIVSGLMRTTSFESQPLCWREALGGGGTLSILKMKVHPNDVVENKPRAKMPMGHPRMLLKLNSLSDHLTENKWLHYRGARRGSATTRQRCYGPRGSEMPGAGREAGGRGEGEGWKTNPNELTSFLSTGYCKNVRNKPNGRMSIFINHLDGN